MTKSYEFTQILLDDTPPWSQRNCTEMWSRDSKTPYGPVECPCTSNVELHKAIPIPISQGLMATLIITHADTTG